MSDLRVTFPAPCDEAWEAMEPKGCHRTCAKCDRVVHDLSQYDVTGVEKLLRDEPDSCVRARIDAFGVVATKSERHGNVRRMVTAVSASAGLLISSPVMARTPRADGAIVGVTLPYGQKTTVTAKDAAGKSYRTKVRSNGRYNLKHVPPGTYEVEFATNDDCGSWTVSNVIVGAGETVVADEPNNDSWCLVVGLLRIDNREG